MKTKTIYACVECGSQSPKWLGRCAECGAWNSLQEEKAAAGLKKSSVSPIKTALTLSEVDTLPAQRFSTGLGEFDRCLGGGMLGGGVILLGGEPGIGKSTLALQTAIFTAKTAKTPVMYISAEESPSQIKDRAARLEAAGENLFIVAESSLQNLLEHAKKLKPALIIVDSVQMLADETLPGAPGSINQARECSASLVGHAKQNGNALLIVSHVTKDGSLAGPKSIEHMVDTVLSFEGDRRNNYRILRTLKNRFGPSSELGIFEMGSRGLLEIKNAAGLFLEAFGEEKAGACVFPHMEGTRALLVEIQALVARAVYGTPNRTASGLDRNRLNMLLAVLDKRGGLFLSDQDVYVNAAGGLHVSDPASDLPVALAVASSFLDKIFPKSWGRTVVFGELGLGGETRPVPNQEARLRESAQLGFETALIPENGSAKIKAGKLKLIKVAGIQQALEQLQRPLKIH